MGISHIPHVQNRGNATRASDGSTRGHPGPQSWMSLGGLENQGGRAPRSYHLDLMPGGANSERQQSGFSLHSSAVFYWKS